MENKCTMAVEDPVLHEKSNLTDTSNMHDYYSIYVDGFDWGPCVTEVILEKSEIADITKLKVIEKRQVQEFHAPDFPIVVKEFERTVTGVGKTSEDKTMISLKESPEEGNPFVWSLKTGYNRWSNPYELRFIYEGKQLNVEPEPVQVVCRTDSLFKEKKFTSENGTKLKYAVHQPKGESHQLLIWLHGLGEGGDDTRILLLGNKVSALAEEDYQNALGDTWILAPQCPTYWMDTTGKGELAGMGIKNDGTSYYLSALIELIESFKKEINAEKTVISGCSNGGFMTVLLAMRKPDIADGWIPICEAQENVFISDADIDVLRNLPMYFIFAENDDTVNPDIYEKPAIERLRKAGADHLHVFHPKDVHDTSGKYDLPDGTAHPYPGHWSWLYYFNDQCDADGMKTSEFIKEIFRK